MTELQQIEKNILACALEIVDRLHLAYFLVCGSALGAVKYNGFIPWDDDIDIAIAQASAEKGLYGVLRESRRAASALLVSPKLPHREKLSVYIQ